MKTPEQIYAMLQEAKVKFKESNEKLKLECSEQNKKDMIIAFAEINAFRAVLGSDEVRLSLIANKEGQS